MRRDPMVKARDGVGTTVFDHILEVTEMETNCRVLAKITLEPGASIGYHQHVDEEDIYYILRGIATVNDNGQIITVYPGECVYLRAGDSHGIANDGQEPLEFISIILTHKPPAR